MLIEITNEIRENLSKTELAVVRYINEHEKDFSKLSMVDIAFETYSSPATVLRAIKKCNISGFNELRFRSVQKENSNSFNQVNEILLQSLNEVQSITECISIQKLVMASEMIKKLRQFVC